MTRNQYPGCKYLHPGLFLLTRLRLTLTAAREKAEAVVEQMRAMKLKEVAKKRKVLRKL